MKLDSCENEVIKFDGETGRVGMIIGLKGKLTASNDWTNFSGLVDGPKVWFFFSSERFLPFFCWFDGRESRGFVRGKKV